MEIIEQIFGGFLLVIMGFFCYMSAHCNEEMRKGKTIRLPWEKKRKIFDKSDITYRDGDNT
tara:strand:- start:158 stop:340 length:183 start_codon:yes stop_codon:yes gene_type:complete